MKKKQARMNMKPNNGPGMMNPQYFQYPGSMNPNLPPPQYGMPPPGGQPPPGMMGMGSKIPPPLPPSIYGMPKNQ